MKNLYRDGDGTFGRTGRPRPTVDMLRSALESGGERNRPTRLRVACPCGPTDLAVGPKDTPESLLQQLVERRACGTRHVD